MECFYAFWAGVFVKGKETKTFKLEFRAETTAEVVETVSGYIQHLESEGWKKRNDRLRMLREVSNG